MNVEFFLLQATSAVQFASAVKVKSLWKKLGDREEWLNKDWVEAVKGSKTLSRLRFCIAMLDYCVMWDTSSMFTVRVHKAMH